MREPYQSATDPREGIGYARVSTTMQARYGRGLEHQTRQIRDWCEVSGFRVHTIYEDAASAAGKDNLRHRPGFVQATREALRKGVPLIVSDISRASRDWATLEKMIVEEGLRVVSVKDGGEVSFGILHERVGQAARQARRTSQGTRKALSEVAKVKLLGAKAGHRKAARASAAARIDKKFQVLERVVDHFEKNPDFLSATSREIADRLNRESILTGWNRPWTASSVRGKLNTIKGELEFRRREAAEDDAPDVQEPLEKMQNDVSSSESRAHRQAAVPQERTEPAADPEDQKILEKNPFYRMF